MHVYGTSGFVALAGSARLRGNIGQFWEVTLQLSPGAQAPPWVELWPDVIGAHQAGSPFCVPVQIAAGVFALPGLQPGRHC